MARASRSLVAALVLAGPARRVRAPADVARRSGGPGHVPDLPHDARPVRLARRAADRGASSSARIAQCETAREIKHELVANFGAGILAAPPHKGFDLLAWWLPLGGIIARRRSRRVRRLALEPRARARRRRPAARSRDRRQLDELLARYGLMGVRLPVAFLAGFVSVMTPCVLPLVPGLPLGALERRGRAARRARQRAARRRREPAVHPRLHRRLRRARRRRRGDRRPVSASAQTEIAGLRARRARARVRRPAAGARAHRRARPAARARAAAARARCSAAHSPCARRRASAPCSRRCSCSRATPAPG